MKNPIKSPIVAFIILLVWALSLMAGQCIQSTGHKMTKEEHKADKAAWAQKEADQLEVRKKALDDQQATAASNEVARLAARAVGDARDITNKVNQADCQNEANGQLNGDLFRYYHCAHCREGHQDSGPEKEKARDCTFCHVPMVQDKTIYNCSRCGYVIEDARIHVRHVCPKDGKEMNMTSDYANMKNFLTKQDHKEKEVATKEDADAAKHLHELVEQDHTKEPKVSK